MNGEIEELIKNIQNKLTLEGKKRVFEENKELKSNDLKEWQDPEEFTREHLIDKILYDILKVERTGPKNFKTSDGTPRKVDYAIKYNKNRILLEAKPVNADLFEKSTHGAVNQILGVFRLGEARDSYDFGVASDGLKWIFINKKGDVTDELTLEEDFSRIKKLILGEEKVTKIKLEEISKKFYEQYNDLLNGTQKIPRSDCLVNSIENVENEGDREEIAQAIIDRLIFIKFLQARGVIKEDILEFLYNLQEHDLNLKLGQLFFQVMNKKEAERGSIDPHFSHIPYLNGSLFEKIDVEKRNSEYRVKSRILQRIIEFLHKFRFVHIEELETQEDVINPEILGYIFEKAMTATDRKGTGAYYTPKEITKYIAEKTIYPTVIEKANNYLMKSKGYKKTELLKNINELFILRETTLNEIWNKILLNLTVCDNACGSGAFLLAVANVLFDLNKKINDKLGLKNTDVALKKLVIKNLYGVDTNPRAKEIAMLRLWLWLVESYKPEHIEPLPNIEYNLRVGNSLIGYVDIEQFGTTKVTLDDFLESEETTKILLTKFRILKTKYQKSVGDEARKLKNEIECIRLKIKKKLDKELYREMRGRKIDVTKEEFLDFHPFHWGFEFYEIFDLDIPNEKRGFDVIAGNPPYINIRVLSKVKPKEKPVYKEYYSHSAYKNYDIYALFFERSIETLSRGGRLGYITSNKFCATDYGFKIRDYLLQFTIEKIIDVSKIRVFEDAGVYPNITVLNKASSKKNAKIKAAIYYDLAEVGKDEVPILQDHYKNDEERVFYIADKKDIEILEYIIENNRQLKNYGEVNSGTTGFDYSRWGELITETPKTKEYLPFIATGNITRFKVDWDKPINYLSTRFQKAYLQYDDIISEGKWKQFKSKKLLIRGIANFPTAGVDNIGYAMATGTYSMISYGKLSHYYLSGIINSKLIEFFYLKKYLAKHLAGDDIGFNVGQLNSIPIPEPNEKQKIIVEKLSNILSQIKEPEDSFLYELLNCIIYELYFRDLIKSNLGEALIKYLDTLPRGNIENLITRLKTDKKIEKELKKIKDYKWVKIIEEN